MGVEYRRYLIPKPNTFAPSLDQVAALVDALKANRWIIDPRSEHFASIPFESSRLFAYARETGYFVRTAEGPSAGLADLASLLATETPRDRLLSWPVDSLAAARLEYPLEPHPYSSEQEAAWCYYEFQIHCGEDFLYHTSEVVEPFEPAPRCQCGVELVYYPEGEDPFYDGRIRRACQACGNLFDPSKLTCSVSDGWTGDSVEIAGGAAYRFAVVVDCGKCFGDTSPAFKPKLRGLIEKVLGVSTYEVADFY